MPASSILWAKEWIYPYIHIVYILLYIFVYILLYIYIFHVEYVILCGGVEKCALGLFDLSTQANFLAVHPSIFLQSAFLLARCLFMHTLISLFCFVVD